MSKYEFLDVAVKINEGDVQLVDEDAFVKNLPEDLDSEVFEKVDDYRSHFAASVVNSTLEEAKDLPKGFISFEDISLGGNTTMGASIHEDGELLIDITTSRNIALSAVMEKAAAMFEESSSESDEDTSDDDEDE